MLSTSPERFYSGKASGQVTVREAGLTRRLELHAALSGQERRPFTWGRKGTGGTQLALALLADALGDDTEATWLHQDFHRLVITNFPERWTITRTRILAHVRMMKYRAGAESSIAQMPRAAPQ